MRVEQIDIGDRLSNSTGVYLIVGIWHRMGKAEKAPRRGVLSSAGFLMHRIVRFTPIPILEVVKLELHLRNGSDILITRTAFVRWCQLDGVEAV